MSSLLPSERARRFRRAGDGFSSTAVWLQLEKKLMVLLQQRSWRRSWWSWRKSWWSIEK